MVPVTVLRIPAHAPKGSREKRVVSWNYFFYYMDYEVRLLKVKYRIPKNSPKGSREKRVVSWNYFLLYEL